MTKRAGWCVLWCLVGAVSSTAAQSAPALPNPAAGRLRPGDVIKLWISQEKDLSGEFLVPETGRVVFPLIGERIVVSADKSALRDSIIGALRTYVKNPGIEVSFLKRISILGAVREPGVHNVDETMTVATALALAGGAVREGRQDEVELYRGEKRIVATITRGARLTDLPLESGDQLFVPERSWAARNTPIIVALVSGMVSFGIALLARN